MRSDQMLTVKINYLQEKIQGLQSVIEKHNEKVQSCQELIWKLEVDIEVAQDTHTRVKLMNEKDTVEMNYRELSKVKFAQEETDITRLNNLLEMYRNERDGSSDDEDFDNI